MAFGDPKTLRWYDRDHSDVPTELYMTMPGSEITPGKGVLVQAAVRTCQGWRAVQYVWARQTQSRRTAFDARVGGSEGRSLLGSRPRRFLLRAGRWWCRA